MMNKNNNTKKTDVRYSFIKKPSKLMLPKLAIFVLAFVLVGTIISFRSFAASTLTATPSNFSSIISSAQPGDVVELSSGSYGTWAGVSKSGMVTIKPATGASVSMGVALTSSASNLRFDGFSNFAGWDLAGSTNIQFANTTFTQPMQVRAGASGIVFDNVVFDNLGHGTWEGRLSLSGSNGVVVKNSHFGNGGCSDGIQLNGDANNTIITNNVFSGIREGSCVEHADPIQMYGSLTSLVTDNYFYGNSTGVMNADGNGSPMTLTNNVFIQTDYPYGCACGVDNSTLNHNVVVGGTLSIITSNTGPGSNSVLKDNVSNITAGGTGNVYVNNVSPSSVSFVGGSGRCAYALTAASASAHPASDGTTTGLNDCSGGGTTPPPAPTPTPPPPTPTPPPVTPPPSSGSTTIWPSTAVPANPSDADTTPVELGTKFRSDVAGNVVGVKFYKGSTNTGTHTGSLWNMAGTRLATVTFSGETASGWQQATFASPVAITANTTYIISYFTPTGNYAGDNGFFATKSVDAPPLHALKEGTDGSNGVYLYASGGGFPNATFGSTNYWVDVVFSATVATPDTIPPAAPTGLVATPTGSSQINLSWTASSDNIGVTTYNILRDGSVIAQVNAPTTTYSDTGLNAATTYSYQVQALDAAANVSASSGAVSATTQSAPDTTAPTVSNLNPIDGAVVSGNVAVSANATDNVGVTKVEFYLNNVLTSSLTSSPYSFGWNTMGVANGPYTITAKAYDAAGNVSTPASVNITVNNADTQAPSIPTGLSALASSPTRVNLSWTASTDNVAVHHYVIWRDGVAIGTSPTTSYSDATVASSSTYYYTVTAVDAAGNSSSPSASASVTTPAPPDTIAPIAPTLALGLVTSTQINLSWNAVTDPSGIKTYHIYRDATEIAVTTSTTYGDATVTAGTQYSYTVKAEDGASNLSVASNQVSATPPIPPPVTITLAPTADAYISNNSTSAKKTNYGSATSLKIDASPVQDSLIKFTVSGVGTRTVTGAKLRLYVTDASTSGGNFYPITSNTWSESTVTWNNQPAHSTTKIGSLASVFTGGYVEVDVTSLITGDGTYGIFGSSASNNVAAYNSKEASSNKPQLVLTVR